MSAGLRKGGREKGGEKRFAVSHAPLRGIGIGMKDLNKWRAWMGHGNL